MKISQKYLCLAILLSVSLLTIRCSEQQNKNKSLATTQILATNPTQKNPYYSRTDTNSLRNVPLTEWKKILSPYVYSIAFEKGTDKKFKGYWNTTGLGTYYCAVCGNKLFRSSAKFASTCGWPSFFKSEKEAVEYDHDDRYGMHRIEVICKRCGAHLGHVFNDGPQPTGLRYCMNSSVLDFVADDTTSNGISQDDSTGNNLRYKQIIENLDNTK